MSVPAGSGAASSQSKSAVRAVRNVSKDYNYTLTVDPYPSGFNPPCQEINLDDLGQIGSADVVAEPVRARRRRAARHQRRRRALASTGDSMHAHLDVQYGNMRFIAGSGNFKLDSVDDSAALLTITDNTTGYSPRRGLPEY